MKADEEGFYYPSIDASKCRHCGKCASVCPVMLKPAATDVKKEPRVYAAWSLDEEVRYDSTSGGVFTELAKAVLLQNGYVAGARYNNRHLVEHTLIDRMEDIPLLRQSKYIQSETKDTFNKIEAVLQTGKQVLFVGTPCQCAGLNAFLRKSYDNLILCDFICRGVNSPKVYSKYLEELESEYGSRVRRVWFKNKSYGWNEFGTKIVFDDGQEYFRSRDEDPFMYGYIKKDLNLYMRPSCGQCGFKGISRPVDITLGDFWGVKFDDYTDIEHGVSAVMLHSIKGIVWFDKISSQLFYEEKQTGDIIPFNPCLTKAAGRGIKSSAFYTIINTSRFSEAISHIDMED